MRYLCIDSHLIRITFQSNSTWSSEHQCRCRTSLVKTVWRNHVTIILISSLFSGVENLTHRANRLRVLDLSDSSLITDKSVTSVIRNCLYLEHVAFSRCYVIAPIAYAYVFKWIYISEKSLCFYISSLKQLRHLNSLDIFGVVDERGLQKLNSLLGSSIVLNQQRFSYVARPTYGLRRTSVWGLRTRPWTMLNEFVFLYVCFVV